MTLCIAWSDPSNNIHMAADSRISLLDGRYSDYGIKLLSIPIRVYGPTNQETGQTKEIFRGTYGLCFAGTFTSAYLLREYLIVILRKLQTVPKYAPVSFPRICDVVKRFFSYLPNQLTNDLETDYSIEFMLTGYCPEKNRLMIAIFKEDNSGADYEIIESRPFIKTIGNGADEFDRNYSSIPRNQVNNCLRAFKQTIDECNVPEVGGNIQYGRFVGNDFEINGVRVIEQTAGSPLTVKFCYAGIDVSSDFFEGGGSDLNIMGTFWDINV